MKKTFLFLLVSGLAHYSYGQKTIAEKLDEVVSAYTNVGKFNGAVLVSRRGEILLQKGYGIKNDKKGELLSADDVFQLYSITKTFTSTLVMKLEEEGKLKLSDKLEKYYPGFPEGNTITIENLLTHTSGIYDYTRGYNMPDMKEKTLVHFLRSKPLDFPPGTQWSYSNSGYWLLGFIIEKVTGLSYEEALKQYIFNPLQMKNAGLDYKKFVSKYKTTGYITLSDSLKEEAEIYDSPGPFAAGAIYATVGDVYKYYVGVKENKILTSDAYKKAFTPYKNDYGYGWVISSFDGNKTIGHSGGAAGFRTNFIMIPDKTICIVVLSNSEQVSARFITGKLLEVLFDKFYIMPKETLVDNKILAEYTGYYRLNNHNVQITISGHRLAVEPYGEPKNELLALGKNYFYSPETGFYLGFQKNEYNEDFNLVIYKGNEIIKTERFIPSWGIIGTATTSGWEGNDIEMTKDKNEKSIWRLKNIKLNDGEIKFRFADGWNISYGDNKQDRQLESDGENIRVSGGVYDIVLDLRDPKSPKYELMKR